jgi:hypothetical protein
MKTFKVCLFVAVSAGTFTIAQATSPDHVPVQVAQQSSMSTGTILKKDIRWESKIPLNKPYSELTPEQKEALHAMYPSLRPGDEPPFPEKGIKPIFNTVKNAQHVLQARGELDMVVTVDPDGKAVKVENLGNVQNPRMLEATQQALLQTKYKPGLCSGTPCTMQFRFQQKLKSG